MNHKGGWHRMGAKSFGAAIGLAMAGHKNPWGGGSNASGESPDASGDKPEADPSKSDGPRNPWLPPAGDGAEPPRRSASIEDIFRNRTGAKRRGGGGGGGGSFPRLPDRPDGKSWLPLIAIGVAGV